MLNDGFNQFIIIPTIDSCCCFDGSLHMLILASEHGLVHQCFIIKCLSDSLTPVSCHCHCFPLLFVKYEHDSSEKISFVEAVLLISFHQNRLYYLSSNSSFFYRLMQEHDLLCFGYDPMR